MGLTHVRVRVANPAHPRKTVRLELLVDSGAAYSIIPAPILRALGIKPLTQREFILADGTVFRRKMGTAIFFYNGEKGGSPVIFGEKGDSPLLGMVSLEALGLILDPFRRELRPLPMILAASPR